MSTHYRYAQPEHGMFLGYAGVDQEQMRAGIERLRLAFQDLERSGTSN